MANTDRVTRDFLLYGIIPVWVGAGVADWWCHRRTHIEENAGLPESLSHVAMLAQAGLPATLALFLEIDPPLLALTYATVATHTATAYWDVAYAAPRREVTPTEQHVHAFLEVLPMTAAAFLSAMHWEQVRQLFRGSRRHWRVRAKRRPLGPRYVAGLLATLTVGLALPFAEEVVRCARAALRRRVRDAAARLPVPPTPELGAVEPVPASAAAAGTGRGVESPHAVD